MSKILQLEPLCLDDIVYVVSRRGKPVKSRVFFEAAARHGPCRVMRIMHNGYFVVIVVCGDKK